MNLVGFREWIFISFLSYFLLCFPFLTTGIDFHCFDALYFCFIHPKRETTYQSWKKPNYLHNTPYYVGSQALLRQVNWLQSNDCSYFGHSQQRQNKAIAQWIKESLWRTRWTEVMWKCAFLKRGSISPTCGPEQKNANAREQKVQVLLDADALSPNNRWIESSITTHELHNNHHFHSNCFRAPSFHVLCGTLSINMFWCDKNIN